jgi:hypothetical protein
MMMMLPRIICQSDAVMYSCATSNSAVHSKSQNEGIISITSVARGMVSRSAGGFMNCWPSQMMPAGTMPRNMSSSIMMGLLNSFSSPLMSTALVS